jgi:2-methylcitrate dehydratase PrpD
MAVRSLTARAAAFAVETPSAELSGGIETVRLVILDTVAVALAAATRPIGRIALAQAASAGGQEVSSVFGSVGKLPAPAAAFANGVLANAYVFEEGSHLSTQVFPAALAIAEREGKSGRDLLDAFIVGYEAGARLTEAFDASRRAGRGPSQRGWWHGGLAGPIAATVAVTRLLGLDVATTAQAIGIATCGAGGFRRNAGTMGEPLHSGNAARDGIRAAELARLGFTADDDILGAPLGMLAALNPAEDRDDAPLRDRLGKPLVLSKPARFKCFPSCTPIQVDLQALLDLRAREPFSADEVEAIEADLHPVQLLRDQATEENSAGFCAAYLVASTVLHGAVGFDQTSLEAMSDRRVQALAARVRHRPDKKNPRVLVRLTSGREMVAPVTPLRRPEGLKGIEPKFDDLAGRVLQPAAVVALKKLILTLEREPGVARFAALAAGRASS